jgi:hypothetical protein
MAMLVFAASAQANSLDYACSGGVGCNGTIVKSGGNYSTTGISVVEAGTPTPSPNEGGTFVLAFNTANTGMLGSISLTGPANLMGTITSWSATSTGAADAVVTLSTFWPSLPAAYAAFLQSPNGIDFSTSTYVIRNGAVVSSDTVILGSEASSMALLGLVMLGALLVQRKKLLA